jgi:cell division septum initiation protein DivIVA
MAGFRKRTEKDLEKMAGFRKRTAIDLERIVELLDRVEDRVERLETERNDTADRLAELLERTAAVDARLTSVSRELAAQIDELGRDLNGDTDIDPARINEIIDAALGTIRDGQNRLANEQARYQIEFRKDIAVLIEQLRR